MKRLNLILLCTLLSFSSFAQWPGAGGAKGQKKGPSIKGKITGSVTDTMSKEAIEFATIVLIDSKSGKEADGGITDERGHFKLQNVSSGKYDLYVSFLGYTDKIIKGIELTLEKPDIKLEDIFLTSGLMLDEVTVTGEAALFENRIDKLVFNADKDVTSAGGDAADVLRKVPMLSVDFDGNVSLRGSSNIRVLINGKPSNFFSENLADALKTIPADQIKTVEVITQPSAKYDGEGTAGIINIITKKKNIQGFTGGINGSVGTRSNRGSLNLSAAKGRFGVNANLGGWYSWPREGTTSFYREDIIDGQKRVLDQNGINNSNFLGPNASIGAFYDINAYNSLSTSFSFRSHGSSREGTTNAVFNDPINNVYQEYTRQNDGSSFGGGFDWTSDFRRTFEKAEQELTFAVQLSGSKRDSDNKISQEDDFGINELLTFKENQENNSLNLETTFQLDYVHPVTKKIKLETGGKSVFRKITSTYNYENFNFATQIYETDYNRSDVFNYEQDVYAGYMSFNIKLGKKYSMVAGARYEHTGISGFVDSGETQPFNESYDNILPSIFFSRKLKNFSMLKLSLVQRIQRPGLRNINPYVDESDNRNISYGNPELSPEITNQVELGYNTMIKGVMFNGAVYYRHTSDIIERFLEIDPNGVSITTYQNIGTNSAIGLNFFTSTTIAKIWSIRAGANISTYNAEGTFNDVELSQQAVVWNGNFNSTLSFKKGFKVEAFGFFRPKRRTIQGFVSSFGMFSMGAKKEFWDKRASLGIRIVEPFSKYKEFPSELSGENFTQRSNTSRPFRSFGLSFSYRFGKLDFKQRSRRSKIKNDDLKQGGDDNNM
jgi:outer membrane receptor protein involved in Fe transport